ncbi:MAG TPA: IS4 family transposase [Candidatus Competibacteraceae bacterium]|nr:IS4 family transposase [Candidatus Competibacteraceae bacterium]HSA47987.1 IS4 family transposase [Candidatus Competibacteraceae bacterium]
MNPAASAIESTRRLLDDEGFKRRHRASDQAFTRVRCWPFAVVWVVILRKSVKSLQNVVNEAMAWLMVAPVTASAFSQARYKLQHTAFIELNQQAVVASRYQEANFRTFWGFRVLAIDGSKLHLPDTDDVRDALGTIAYSNGKDPQIQGEHPYALASVLYDVLNRIALDATLGRTDAYEVDLAIGHLAHTGSMDLLILDRNYPAYRLLAELTQRERHFVIRCSAASFAVARQMLRGEGSDSQVVTLAPGAGQAPLIRQQGLPMTLTVRFVRVRLSTGEWEVLVTSLRDEVAYPTADFLELYHWRWGVETFYGLLKSRLDLENFSGLGAEAVRQDFHATVYLTGLESLLTDAAQAQLEAKTTQHPQTVNRAVSFNAIKHHALDLLCSDLDTLPLMERLTALFLTHPTCARPQRHPPRKKTSARVLLDFHRRQKKHCY